MPALPQKLYRVRQIFFVGAAPVYPGGTDVSTATDCTPNTIGRTPVGTFFAFGGLVAGLPQSSTASPNDLFYVVWHFRIDGKGGFDTTGPVRSTSTYVQTITGSTNPGLVPTHGAAKVTNLGTGTASTGPAPLAAFKITTPQGWTTSDAIQALGPNEVEGQKTEQVSSTPSVAAQPRTERLWGARC